MHQVLSVSDEKKLKKCKKKKRDPPLGRWLKICIVWRLWKLGPELAFGRLWHRSSQGLWSHHRYQKEQTRQVLNSSLERKNETRVNRGRSLSSRCGTCTDVSLVKRQVGGEARPVNAARVCIYAKYIGDSLHGHAVKICTAAKVTRNSERIMAWNVPVCEGQRVLSRSWEAVRIGGGVTHLIGAIDVFHWWGHRGQRGRELPSWRLLRVHKRCRQRSSGKTKRGREEWMLQNGEALHWWSGGAEIVESWINKLAYISQLLCQSPA